MFLPKLFCASRLAQAVARRLSRRFRPAACSAGCAAFLFFLLKSVRAADVGGDFLADEWVSENGLPDSSVTAVAQTPDGYLWVGTYNGVTRFDGVRFVTFDPANTPALTHARIRHLAVDNTGVLWVSTYDGSLTKYENGVFTLERRNTRATEGDVSFVAASSNEVFFLSSRGELLRKLRDDPPIEGWLETPPPARGIGAQCCQDGGGTLWYRDGARHLWRWRGNGFESLPDAAGLAGQNVNCLTIDSKGRLWAGTDQEFAFWDGQKFRGVVPAGEKAALDVTFLSVDPGGNVWAVANGCVCLAAGNRWLLPPDASRNIFSGNPGHIGGVPDNRDGMWFFNYGRGLWNVSANGDVRQLGQADGFPGGRVYDFIADRDGNWWAGLDAGGLVRLRARQFHAPSSGENTLTPAARTVCADETGTVWIGCLGGGLDCWRGGQITNIPVIADGANAGPVFCACPDDRGRLWLSAGDEDLFVRSDGLAHRVTPVVHGVKAVLADHSGCIWAGTTSGLFFSKDGKPADFQLFKGLSRRSIRSLAQDAAGAVWVGTANGELARVTGDAVTVFQPPNGPGSASVWSLLADGDTIWAGTFRGGLLRFQNGRFVQFDKKNGLPDDVICQILDDGQGNLWLASHQGVFRVAKSALNAAARQQDHDTRGQNDETAGQPDGSAAVRGPAVIPCVVYGRSDGMPSLECSGGYQPAGWRDGAGRLWFATAKGATWVLPEEVRPNLKPPLVAIEEILVDGRAVRTKTGAGASKTERGSPSSILHHSPALEIPPGRHQLEFRYTGLSFASPERVQFRYRLDGLDEDWVQAGTRRFAQYNFLPPGKYRFRVLACNSDGFWNKSGRELAVTIFPHVYETWWFQTLAALLVLGTVAAVVRQIATRRLHLRMEQLERRQAVERERTRIAKDIHDDLGASLNLIAVLGDLAKQEKSGERIEKMSSTARQAVKSLDEIVWAVNPRNDTLSHLVDYICQYTNDYLRDADIRCLLDVPEQTPAREVPSNVRHNLFLAVKEALQNVVKHARASRVELRLHLEGDQLRMQIADNGCGFGDAPHDDRADGLNNMRQRLAEIGGECRIESAMGTGTTVNIALALSAPTAASQTFIR
jgi:signal transduction histidine kinase/ligand-binding sensor domain-containing protein